jgi:intracellular sulfur oxidation DsrE/DsrF family protein
LEPILFPHHDATCTLARWIIENREIAEVAVPVLTDGLSTPGQKRVEFRVCSNALTRAQIATHTVTPEAVRVPSGIAEIGRLQEREGYTYLRL